MTVVQKNRYQHGTSKKLLTK